MNDLFSDKGAVFSDCGNYRYRLWRYWDRSVPPLVFVLLNPSTATATVDDPTVARCQRRAKSLGYGGLEVVNIFAFRATDPKIMKRQADPVGPDNDQAILDAVKLTLARGTKEGRPERGRVIVAWGQHGNHRGRGKQVIKMLRDNGIDPFYLTLGKDGQPGHPLYVSYDVSPKAYWAEDIDCTRCFHKACCVCFSVTLYGKEKERFEIDPNDVRYMKRTGAGQCIYFSIEEGTCTVHKERPEECRNWSCRLDPRWPVVLEAYLSGRDKCTR